MKTNKCIRFRCTYVVAYALMQVHQSRLIPDCSCVCTLLFLAITFNYYLVIIFAVNMY